MHRAHNGESGESLVAVLVAVGIIGVAATILASSFGLSTQVDKQAKARIGFRDFEDGFNLFLLRQLKAYARETGCQPGRFGDYFVAKDPKKPIKIGQWASPRYTGKRISVAPDAPVEQQQAAARCEQPIIAGSSDSDFRFCLQLETLRSNEPSHSFLAGNRVFAEIRVQLTDLPSGGSQTCSSIASAAAGAYTVAYGVYWGRFRQGTTKQDFFRYLGWFHAAN